MLNIVKKLKPFKLKPHDITIDNVAFKLHYRVTTIIFIIATALISSQELIGEHIRCISDKGVAEHVINTFCFFTSTFTVVKHLDQNKVDAHEIAHPGVGPMGINEDVPIKQHAYYQWVPFVLVLQGFMFYLPYFLWKRQEGGRLKRLVQGLDNAPYVSDKVISIGDKKTTTKTEINDKFTKIKFAFKQHLMINRSWAKWIIVCEFLNLLNLVFQVVLTNTFLGGQFYSLGTKVFSNGLNNSVNTLDVVFPKITKCTFHKYGPSGTIQSHDAMCVMALNIINEKIYVFLWFWFAFLLATTLMALLWRLLTIILHARSRRFNQFAFSTMGNSAIKPWAVLSVTKQCHYSDWLFMWYLAKNIDGLVFKNFFCELAQEMLDDESNLDKSTLIDSNEDNDYVDRDSNDFDEDLKAKLEKIYN